MGETIIRHWPDIEYTAVATLNPHRVAFKIYSIIGFPSEEHPEPSWTRKGATDPMETVETFDAAQVFLSGDIKWDGCSNWWVDEQHEQDCMTHFCSRKNGTDLGVLLGRLYDLAAELMPQHAEELR